MAINLDPAVEAQLIADAQTAIANGPKRDPVTSLLVEQKPVVKPPEKQPDPVVSSAAVQPAVSPTIGSQELPPHHAARVEQHLAEDMYLSPEAIEHVRLGNPITRESYNVSANWMRNFKADQRRVAALYAGDTDLARLYAHHNTILSMPVVDMSYEEWVAKYGPKLKAGA